MRKCRMSLTMYDLKPEGMIAYLRYNGWHFSKKMCEWAVSRMRKDSEPVTMIDKASVDEMLRQLNVENDAGYDAVYVANMAKSDFWKTSIEDEAHLARFVKDMIDDEDQKDGFIFNRFYADCCHNGVPIPWEDLL